MHIEIFAKEIVGLKICLQNKFGLEGRKWRRLLWVQMKQD
jgi:hypothetical protein